MEAKDFELEIISGKRIYKHIKNGNKRTDLLHQAKVGEITAEEMRNKAKKLKYLYSEKDYLESVK